VCPCSQRVDPHIGIIRSEVRLLKTLKVRVSRLPLFFMAACLFFCASIQTFPATALGTQCPTAPVQMIDVAVKDCCGKVIGHIQRTPKVGDTEFLQCRCAEKKAPKHESATGPKFEVFTSTTVCLDFRSAIPPVAQTIDYIGPESWAEKSPLTPPPDAA